jgi:hypothetical protein
MNFEIININKNDIQKSPFWFIEKENAISSDFFKELKENFPDDDLYKNNSKKYGRAGDDLFPCDDNYKKLINRSKAWREFINYLQSEDFILKIIKMFKETLVAENIKCDLNNINCIKYTQSRIERGYNAKFINIKKIFDKLNPRNKNNIFTTCDISRANTGYGLPAHCDHSNRLFSLIIYFTNPEDIKMQGGELLIFERNDKKNNDRDPSSHDIKISKKIKPAENKLVLFPSHNHSFHGVSPITKINDYRKFLYIGISSKSQFIW